MAYLLTDHAMISVLVKCAGYTSTEQGVCHGISFTAMQLVTTRHHEQWDKSLSEIRKAFSEYAIYVPESERDTYERKHSTELHYGYDVTAAYLRLTCLKRNLCPEPFRSKLSWDNGTIDRIRSLRIAAFIESIARYHAPSLCNDLLPVRYQRDGYRLSESKELLPDDLICDRVAFSIQFLSEKQLADLITNIASICRKQKVSNVGLLLGTPGYHASMMSLEVEGNGPSSLTIRYVLPNKGTFGTDTDPMSVAKVHFREHIDDGGALWLEWELYVPRALNCSSKYSDIEYALLGSQGSNHNVDPSLNHVSSVLNMNGLHIACQHKKLTKPLLKKVPKEFCNQVDIEGNLPIMYLLLLQSQDGIGLELLKATDDKLLCVPNNEQSTPLIYAMSHNCWKCAAYLLRLNDCQLTATDEDGLSTLCLVRNAPSEIQSLYFSHPSFNISTSDANDDMYTLWLEGATTEQAIALYTQQKTLQIASSDSLDAIEVLKRIEKRPDFSVIYEAMVNAGFFVSEYIDNQHILVVLSELRCERFIHLLINRNSSFLYGFENLHSESDDTVFDYFFRSNIKFLKRFFSKGCISEDLRISSKAIEYCLENDMFRVLRFWYADRPNAFHSPDLIMKVLHESPILNEQASIEDRTNVFRRAYGTKHCLALHCLESSVQNIERVKKFLLGIREFAKQHPSAFDLLTLLGLFQLSLSIGRKFSHLSSTLTEGIKNILHQRNYRYSMNTRIIKNHLSPSEISAVSFLCPTTLSDCGNSWREKVLELKSSNPSPQWTSYIPVALSTHGADDFLDSLYGLEFILRFMRLDRFAFELQTNVTLRKSIALHEDEGRSVVRAAIFLLSKPQIEVIIDSVSDLICYNSLNFILAASIYCQNEALSRNIIKRAKTLSWLNKSICEYWEEVNSHRASDTRHTKVIVPLNEVKKLVKFNYQTALFPNFLWILLILSKNDLLRGDDESWSFAAYLLLHSRSAEINSELLEHLTEDDISQPNLLNPTFSLAKYAVVFDNSELLRNLLTWFPTAHLHETESEFLDFVFYNGTEEQLVVTLKSKLFSTHITSGGRSLPSLFTDMTAHHQSLLERCAKAKYFKAANLLISDLYSFDTPSEKSIDRTIRYLNIANPGLADKLARRLNIKNELRIERKIDTRISSRESFRFTT